MARHGRRGTVAQLRRRALLLATRARERVAQLVPAKPDVVELDDVRRRLELMLFALHGRTVRIQDAPAPEPSLLARVRERFTPLHLRARPVAWTVGDSVQLPARLEHVRGDPAGVAHYRLLALVQAERIVRGTASVLPPATTPLERDLFLLRESMAVEARLSRDVGGVARALADARRDALAGRPPTGPLTDAERGVERLVRGALEPDALAHNVALADSTPAESLAWARTTGASLSGSYAGVAPVAHWGGMADAPGSGGGGDVPEGNPFAPRDGAVQFEAQTADRTGTGPDAEGEEPNGDGDAIEDERGALTPTGAPDGSNGESADTSARDGNADAQMHRDDDEFADAGPGVLYPEWAYHEGRYRRDAVTVREKPAEESDGTWATDTLREHAPVVRRIRERFEPLRAQRMRLGQQRDGEELDLQACVQALVDLKTGHTPSDRLYTSVRPARRAMTICLLVDVSASTGFPLPDGQRIVDVARQAVLLASEAFDVLGDDYALLTFSSRGARNVRVATLKDFREPNGARVRQRIAGIEPGDNTRLGAALRHATARLAREPVGRRLLLILSDGRPNDFDGYHEEAGAEDSRQAINEARAQGVFPYCITIDQQDGPEYLPRVFGASGYTVLREPGQLPLALVRVVRQLLVR